MPSATVNGVRLNYALTGDAGPPIVLVHGSWGNRHGWAPVVPDLARRFRVLAYDRRGHSESERPPGQGSVDEDAADLAALIEHLGLAPAHVAGNSFGGSIALRLAARRPDLFRSLTVHEPPLFDLLADRADLAPALQTASAGVAAVAARLAAGEMEEGARLFAETLMVGPGGWERLSPDVRRTMIDNAPTFLDETRDPESLTVALEPLTRFPRPALLTYGDQGPPFYPPVVLILASVLPRAETRICAGAGHVPHASHPAEYAPTVARFAAAADAAGPT